MNFNINEFEYHIDETTLKNGLNCYNKGCVKDIEQLSMGEYHANVDGGGRDKNTYVVHLRIKGDILEESDCSCLDANRGICKHITAVIFSMQANVLNLDKPTKKTRTTKVTANKTATIADKLKGILNDVSHEELVGFVNSYALNDKEFRNLLFSHFMPAYKESLDLYSKQIKAIIKSSSDSYGFIISGGIKVITKEISHILSTGRTKFESGNFRGAFYIGFSAITQLTEAMYMANGNSKTLVDTINDGNNLLVEISKADIEEELRIEIFETLLTNYSKNTIESYSYDSFLLRLATDIAKQDNELKKVKSILENIIKNKSNRILRSFNSIEYMLMLIVISKTNPGDVDSYIEDNVNNPDFRLLLIKKALSEQDYKKVLILAKDGIKTDALCLDLSSEWEKYKLEAYLGLNDDKNIVESAYKLMLLNCYEAKPYYDIIRKYVPVDKWDNFFENLINKLDEERKKAYNEIDYLCLICDVLSWNGQYDKVLNIVLKHKDIYLYEYCQRYLVKIYNKEFIEGCIDVIITLIKESDKRAQYKYLCQSIVNIIKLDTCQQTTDLIAKVRKLYARRYSFIEELDKVVFKLGK